MFKQRFLKQNLNFLNMIKVAVGGSVFIALMLLVILGISSGVSFDSILPGTGGIFYIVATISLIFLIIFGFIAVNQGSS